MAAKTFYEELETLKAYRETRLRLAEKVIRQPDLFPELLLICYQFHNEVSSRACWILEFVMLKNPTLLIPYLDEFTENLKGFSRESSIRPVAKTCQLLTKHYFAKKDTPLKNAINDLHLERITEACFDWLISDVKVAPKAYSIYTLHLLGKKFAWIHPELVSVLKLQIPKQSPGFKAAAIKTLEKLHKEKE
ncbi:adenylosuccinate lyase [Ascidiimonas aurantiaca]|uniref:adenylosuccinate lyase n=1 Tax=Ascidiimonas aurantiaca TaxID=1685432 RepID=UPI0030EE9CDD